MCMLIHHPETAQPFDRAEFLDFNVRNPHGFGVIWRSPNGTIRSRKGLIDPAGQWKMYQSLLANGCTEMVLHWRFRTAGPVNEAMCHPFKATADVLVMHNGVLRHRSTPTKSDTVCFIEDVITPILEGEPEAYHDPTLVPWLDREIGDGNKLILWKQGDPEPIVVGEKKGLWYKGRWFSNTYAWSVPRNVRVPRSARLG